jgi:DNA-binding NtrC family response regulator
MASGEFREDLYYRLNVIHIHVRPLRERGADILLLFNHFLAWYSQVHKIEVPALTPATEDLLLAYKWPGNVRELKNIVERVVTRHTGGAIRPEELPAELRTEPAPAQLPASVATLAAAPAPIRRYPAADAAWAEVMSGKSFWAVVHPLFIGRELTKTDVREIIRRGLETTQGSYRKLVELFHMSPNDYKRFLAFLYQHDCHVAFHPFREARYEAPAESRVAHAG